MPGLSSWRTGCKLAFPKPDNGRQPDALDMDQNLSPDAVTLTKTLCGRLAAAQFSDLSPAAAHQARRGVLDWIGCALAGSGHKTVSTLIDVLQEVSGRPQATVLGRKLKPVRGLSVVARNTATFGETHGNFELRSRIAGHGGGAQSRPADRGRQNVNRSVGSQSAHHRGVRARRRRGWRGC